MRAKTFAAMLANSRASRTMEVADLLAGMYMCEWDRLSRYWEEQDRERIEEFLRKICRISPQRWNSWIEWYDSERREDDRPGWRRLRKRKKEAPDEPLQPSAALVSVLQQAEQLAPFRDTLDGRSLPILTSECVLLCIARNFGTEISLRLVETGLDAARLERDVMFPRRAPLV
ncbi:MAG TPA: hypothetical protein VNM68_04980 [Candidatus Polarisedimenticolia bacterium]|nr:hypothetical protein [Candidatus Polarisedimenticolia bacterium]